MWHAQTSLPSVQIYSYCKESRWHTRQSVNLEFFLPHSLPHNSPSVPSESSPVPLCPSLNATVLGLKRSILQRCRSLVLQFHCCPAHQPHHLPVFSLIFFTSNPFSLLFIHGSLSLSLCSSSSIFYPLPPEAELQQCPPVAAELQ